MEVEITSSTYIKPSSQTPPHLKIYNFSGLDQLSPPIYGPGLFCYAAPTHPEPDHRSLILKMSLSETLSRYYPLAGEIKDGLSVHCSDAGAYYAEARVLLKSSSSSCSSLSRFLGSGRSFNQLASLRRLFPLHAVDNKVFSPLPPGSPVLLVQVTLFPCGGVAIGVLVAHKVLDAQSVGSFLRAWAAAARIRNPAAVAGTVIADDTGAEGSAWNPRFDGESIFPQNELLLQRSVSPGPDALQRKAAAAATRRFVFDATGLASLKEKWKKSTGNNIAPSRVQAVTALFCESILRAFIKISTPPPPAAAASLVVTQAVNLRRKANPPFPSNSIGNYIINAVATVPIATKDESVLMKLLRHSVSKIDEEFMSKIQGTKGKARLAEAVKEEDAAVGGTWRRISFTSWSRVGWYEAANFGWGDGPAWIGSLPMSDELWSKEEVVVDLVVIMDTKDGSGLEAWVYLKGDEMGVLEKDEKLLSFACLDPCPLLLPAGGDKG